MDNQSPQPGQHKISDPQLAAQIAQVQGIGAKSSEPSPPLQTQPTQQQRTNQTQKPADKAVTDADAQAILATFNAQNKVDKSERKLPMGMIFTIISLIVAVAVASALIGSIKSKSNSNSPATNSSSQSNSPTDNTSNQINQDEQSCSNPAVAISQC